MKSNRPATTGFIACVVFAICCWAQAALADTTVRTLRDGRPEAGIDVVIIKAVSGQPVQTGRSGKGGLVRFEGLEAEGQYQVQTPDGTFHSESFAAGSTVEIEVGLGGWNLAGKVGFAVGTSSATYESDAGLDADESGVGGGPEIGLLLLAPPRKLFFYGVRPFLETAVEITALTPDGFEDDAGGDAKIEDSIRWRLGGGVAIPFDVASYAMSVEPSFHYALTSSEFSSQPAGAGRRKKDFTSHAVQLALVTVFPVGTLGPVGMSVDLGVRAHIPVSGKATIGSSLDAEPTIDVQGGIGIRGTFTGLFGAR